jgi:deazaflavin-dependent oxidoreductase (nitroreductase family)
MSDFNLQVIEEFRANDGKVGGMFEKMSLVLLNTVGAKSGEPRVSPVAYADLDGHRYVFASKGGADTNPDWYHNLIAHPDVTVEVGGEKYEATAKPLSGAERDRVYSEQASRLPQFAEYEEKVKGKRTIPVVELVPKS